MSIIDMLFVVSILMVCAGVMGYAFWDMFKQLHKLEQVEKESYMEEEE